MIRYIYDAGDKNKSATLAVDDESILLYRNVGGGHIFEVARTRDEQHIRDGMRDEG